MKKVRLFPFLLALVLFVLPACDSGSETSENTNPPAENTPAPDPNTRFPNFEQLFFQEPLPYSLSYTAAPSGTSLADELQSNFLQRKGELYPVARFPIGADYQGFVVGENREGIFSFTLNVFDKDGQLKDFRQVAGPDGEEVLEAIFTDDETWAVTRSGRLEETGEPIGEGTVSNYGIDGAGKIVEK